MPTIHKRNQQLSLFQLTDGVTQTNNLMPSGMHNSGSRIWWRIDLKGKNEVKSGNNEEQYK